MSVAKCRETSRSWLDVINREKSYKQRIKKMIEESKKKAKKHYYQKTIKGFTPLHLAALTGQTQMVMDLMNELVDKNPSEQLGRVTPLHLAAGAGFASVCLLIIKNIEVENINPKDKRGRTPLHLAAEKGLFSVCKLIIDNVRDKNPKDDCEETPLHLAASAGFESVCHLIIENIEVENMNPKKKRWNITSSSGCYKWVIFSLQVNY